MLVTIIILIIILLLSLSYNIYLKLNFNATKQNLQTLGSQVQTLRLQSTYNFENDTAFLIYLIKFKCTTYFTMILIPASENNLNGKKLLTEENLSEAVITITKELISTFSDDYLILMMKYFTLDALKEFIIENVINEITVDITTINRSKIKNIFNQRTHNGNDITFQKKDLD